jgi:hypothetical protein
MPQLPPPQAEAPQPSAGAPQLREGDEPVAEVETANVEICFSTVPLAQEGQVVVSPQRRISFSNWWEQSAQRYS